MADEQVPMEIMATAPDGQLPAEPDLGPETPPDNDTFETLVKYCMDMYDLFDKSEYRQKKIKDITESHKAYDQIADPALEIWDGASNEVLPLTAITVDNLEPRLTSGLIGREPILLFEMIGMTDKDEPTKIIEQYYNAELKQKILIEAKAMAIVHTLLLEGNYYCLPEYAKNKKKRMDFQYDQQGNIAINPQTRRPNIIPVEETTFEGGNIQSIPFTDILYADDIGTIAEWEKCDKIRKIYPTYGELMQSKGGLGYIAENIGPWLYNETGDEKKSEGSLSPSDKVAGVSVTGKKVIESIECYISYPIHQDQKKEWKEQSNFEEEEIIVTIALKSKKILRIMYKKDILFSNASLIKRVRLFSEEGRSYGVSMYEKIKGMQKGASEVFNAIINSFFVVILGGGFYEEGSGLKGNIVKSPGEYVPVDDISKIKETNVTVNPASYISLFEVIVQLWERAGSISNPQMGRPDSKEKTATEIMMVIQEGNAKFDYQARTTKDEFISILVTLYDLYYQYMPYNQTFMYNGKPTPIPRQLMKRNYKYSLTGSTIAANKMIERKESEELYEIGMKNPLVDPTKITEDLLRAYGKNDLKRYIKPEIQQLLSTFMQDPQGVGAAIQHYVQVRNQTQAEVKQGAAGKVANTIQNKVAAAMNG